MSLLWVFEDECEMDMGVILIVVLDPSNKSVIEAGDVTLKDSDDPSNFGMDVGGV